MGPMRAYDPPTMRDPDQTPTSESPTGLHARLDHLERSQRSLRRWLLGLVLGAGAMLSLAWRPQDPVQPQEVRGSRFVLVDAKGKEHASLEVVNDAPRLFMRDKHGKVRIEIGMRGLEPIAVLKDGDEGQRVGIAVDGAGLPHLMMTDKERMLRFHLALNDEGAPSLLMTHKDGQHSAGLGIHMDGRPWVRPTAGAASQPR